MRLRLISISSTCIQHIHYFEREKKRNSDDFVSFTFFFLCIFFFAFLVLFCFDFISSSTKNEEVPILCVSSDGQLLFRISVSAFVCLCGSTNTDVNRASARPKVKRTRKPI